MVRAAELCKKLIFERTLRRSFLAIADQGIVSLSNFLTGVIMARTLLPEDFGAYSLLFASLLILSGVQNSVITGPIRVLGVSTGNTDSGRGYFGAQIRLQVLLGSLLSLGSALVLVIFVGVKVNLAVTFSICVFFFQLQELVRVINMTRLTLRSLFVLDVVTYGFRLGMLLVLMAAERLTTVGGYVAIAVSCSIGTATYAKYVIGERDAPDALTKVAISNWRYGRWLLLETMAYTASTQVYLYFTALWVDVQSAGALSAVQTMLNVVNILLLGVVGFATPVARQRLLQSGHRAWRRWLWSVGIVLTVFTALVGILASVFARPLLAGIYTPFYAKFAYLVPLLAVSYCFRAANTVLVTSFRTALMPEVGFSAQAASAVATVLVAYPLLRLWGVAGAAMGIAGTQILWTIVYLFYIQKGVLRESHIMDHVARQASYGR